MLRFGTVLLLVSVGLAWGSEVKAQAPSVTCAPVKPIAGVGTTWNFPAGGTYSGGTATVTRVTVVLKSVLKNGGAQGTSLITDATFANGTYTIVINNPTYTPLLKDYFMQATVWIRMNGMPVTGNTSDWIPVPTK